MKMTKSWTLTFAVYIIAFAMLVIEAETDFTITEAQVNIITMLVGSTTAGGVFVSAYKYKQKIQGKIKGVDADD